MRCCGWATGWCRWTRSSRSRRASACWPRPEQEREGRAFARSLRDRIDEVADKYIRPDEGTFDFALMYLPAEAVYYEAVLRDEDQGDGKSVLAHAMRRKVIPVSPHTFYAYLLVIVHGLQGLRVEQRARELQ